MDAMLSSPFFGLALSAAVYGCKKRQSGCCVTRCWLLLW